MDDKTLRELIIELIKDTAAIKENQASMREDIKEHIRRTGAAEAKIDWLNRQVLLVHGALGLITILGILVGILTGLKKI